MKSHDQFRSRLDRAEFRAALSHGLKTPLNSILGFTGLLLSGIEGPLTPAQRESLEAISKAGHHLLELVRELLDASSESTTELEVPRPLNLEAAVDEVLCLFAPQLRFAGFEPRIEGRPWPEAMGTPRALRQILVNFVSNALRYGKPGRLSFCAQAKGEAVELALSNPGAFCEGVFEHRMMHSASEIEPCGLGLAIARELAARMGGRIEIRTETQGGHSEVVAALLLPIQKGVRLGSGALPSHHRTRTSLIAAISHELREPLNAIRGFAQLLEAEIDGSLSPAQRQSVTQIATAAELLVNSLNDVLDLARADVGQLRVLPRHISLVSLSQGLREEINRWGSRFFPEATIHIAHPPQDISLFLDPRLVTKATLALVRHASHPFCASIRIDLEHHFSSLRISVENPSLRVDSAQAEAAFDPFRTIVVPSGRRSLGLGLALAKARTLARLHGGEAWAEDGPATRWLLTFPFQIDFK
ncbi:MAG: HAMP domain-containing histidine kinase [Deltaproteobacteria bacterium]|nr:HAMP domain-containing histidine kinase [Deltaproteobacteria bacterium]